tara:strand:- start:696 stop:854 length:159 start_codon:yes stop_codon:yes gene_type:complete
MMNTVKDSMITIGQGGGAILISWMEFIPEIIRVVILLATLVHIVVKIRKDLK